jgi:YVTN family beta-propeller protein
MPLRSLFALLASLVLVATAPAGTSNSLLDLSPDGKRLLVANPDNDSVTVVDTATRRVLREIKVGEKPEGVTWIGSGPLAATACYHDSQVIFFNAVTGAIVRKLKVAAEPYGIVADKAGQRLWVSHEYPGLVSEIDALQLTMTRELKAGSMVRGIALDSEEKRIYVSEFYTGRLVALDLAKGVVVDSWMGHTTDNLARHVLLHPHRPKAYLAHIRSITNVIDGGGSIFPHLSICDLKPSDNESDNQRRSSISMDTFNGVYVVTNAWEAALSPDAKRIYIVYAGTDDVNVCKVVDDDYREIQRINLPTTVGRNPRAVRVSPDGQTVYIYNTLDFAVGVYDANLKKMVSIPVCEPPKTPEWVRGKVLFNTARQPMSARRWVACASCHPDGHNDGRVWQNPEGLRKTTAMFGMAHTHPIHWSADRDEVQDFEYTIRSPLMRGSGLAPGSFKRKTGFDKIELEEKMSGRSKDLDALAIYCNSFEFAVLSPHIVAPGQLTPQAKRGKKLFCSAAVGCAGCHSGPYYTDSNLKKPYNVHDVGTGQDDTTEKMGPQYDTPTLLGIYRTAPYLHHGKASTLLEVLTVCNKDDKHGKTSQLKAAELDDLVAFLRSLPFEYPPITTPNTVPYRVPPVMRKN